MFRSALSKFFAKRFYPTSSCNWYKNKNYKGCNDQERFQNFLAAMRKEKARSSKEFTSVKATRQYIPSGKDSLDSVLIVPKKEISRNKPGAGLYFVMFFGKLEPYESRFRDMVGQSVETGASILCFNPKGLNSSSGNIENLFDLVEDGIAIVNFLLEQGVSYKQIILQGNSLGAAVQEMVSEHYRKTNGKIFRQVNSNSFRSLSAVVAYYYKLPFLEKLLAPILKYSKWEIVPGTDFYQTGPYRCHIHRLGDRTIRPAAQYHSAINFESDHKKCPKFYKETHKWLYDHSQVIYRGRSKKDPHKLSLHYFEIKDSNGSYHSVYSLINRYLSSF